MALMERMRLSAKQRRVIAGEFLTSFDSNAVAGFLNSKSKSLDRSSIERTNKYGDEGSPWRTPQVELKKKRKKRKPCGKPLIGTESTG